MPKKKQKRKVDLFLDSGAFSAWTQNKSIDIQKYIAFIKEHEEVIDIYANLDVIGIGGKLPNRETAELTLKNQKIMEKAGLSPIPCFHYGEPFSYLAYYVENYDYIALGVAGNSGTKLIPWLDQCFSNYICDQKGFPKTKVHGFAVTSLKLMLRYPWYSVDSTSWVVTGRLGSIYVPIQRGERWVYDETTWKIAVSNKSPNKNKKGEHYQTLPKQHQKIIKCYLEEKGYVIGKSEFHMESQDYHLKENEKWGEKKPKEKTESRWVETILEPGVSNTYQLRDEVNIIYFVDLEKSMKLWPWPFVNTSTKNGLL